MRNWVSLTLSLIALVISCVALALVWGDDGERLRAESRSPQGEAQTDVPERRPKHPGLQGSVESASKKRVDQIEIRLSEIDDIIVASGLRREQPENLAAGVTAAQRAVALLHRMPEVAPPASLTSPETTFNGPWRVETTYYRLPIGKGLRVLHVERASQPGRDWSPLNGWKQTDSTVTFLYKRVSTSSTSTDTAGFSRGVIRLWAVAEK